MRAYVCLCVRVCCFCVYVVCVRVEVTKRGEAIDGSVHHTVLRDEISSVGMQGEEKQWKL